MDPYSTLCILILKLRWKQRGRKEHQVTVIALYWTILPVKNLSNVFILGVIFYSVYEVLYLGFGDLC